MNEVILHVGFAKTASTSIQNALAQNRDVLRKAGVAYARFTLDGREITNHSLALTYLFTDRGKTHHVHVKKGLDEEEQRARAHAELDKALKDSPGKLVISGEEVPFLDSIELERLRDFFISRGVKLRLIGLVRPTVAFLSSLAQQFVKSGMPLSVASNKTPMRLCKHLAKTFPDVEFYSFGDACAHKDGPVGFFLETIGVGLPDLHEDLVSNEAWSDNAVRLCSYLNTHARIVFAGVLNPLREEGDIVKFSQINGPRFSLTKSEVNVPVLEDEIKWLVEHYGDSFAEDLSGLEAQTAKWEQQQVNQAAKISFMIPLHLVPLVYSYFTTSARLAAGANIKPIVEMARHRYFGS